MCEAVLDYAWPFVIGYAVTLAWGQFVIERTLNILWGKLGIKAGERYGQGQSKIIGTVEAVLFVAALYMKKPEFVAFWLGIKTVVKWRHWETDIGLPAVPPAKPRWILGRTGYNLFLLGNALVVLFAAAGWQTIVVLQARDWPQAISLGLGLLAFSIGLLVYSKYTKPDEPLADDDPRVVKPGQNKDEKASATH